MAKNKDIKTKELVISQAERKEKINFSIKSFFIKKFCKLLDFVPTLKKENTTPSKKILHTLVGFCCYVSLLMIPGASYYAANTYRKFNLVFLDQNFSICSLARNALTVYLLLGEVVENILLPTKEEVLLKPKERQAYHRGFRNFLILVGIFIARTYQLFYFELPSKSFYFLGRENSQRDKYFLLSVYYLQSLVVSLLTILVDDYLSLFSIIRSNKLVLYQIGELLISCIYAEPLINYSYFWLFFGISLILIIKIISDSLVSTSFVIEHNSVKGYSKNNVIKASSVLLSALFMHSVAKRACYHFLTMMLDPFLVGIFNPKMLKLLLYLESYNFRLPANWKQTLTTLEIPEYVYDNPLLNDQSLSLNNLMYLPTWDSYSFWYIVLYSTIEIGIIKPFFIYFVTAYTPELKSESITQRLISSNCKIKNVMPAAPAINSNLKRRINILILKSIILFLLTEPIIMLTPIYGFTLRGQDIAHLYNLITSITMALRDLSSTEIETLPSLLRFIIYYNVKY